MIYTNEIIEQRQAHEETDNNEILFAIMISSSCSKVTSTCKQRWSSPPLLQNFYLQAACLSESGGVQSESRLLDMENPAEKLRFEIARSFVCLTQTARNDSANSLQVLVPEKNTDYPAISRLLICQTCCLQHNGFGRSHWDPSIWKWSCSFW